MHKPFKDSHYLSPNLANIRQLTVCGRDKPLLFSHFPNKLSRLALENMIIPTSIFDIKLLRPKLNVLDLSNVNVADSAENSRKLDLSGFRNLHKIAVTSSNLKELPRFPSSALAINGSFNPLETISKEVFKEQRNNLIIILRNCSLSSLEKGWARDLQHLEYLDLSRNLFTSLSHWMFSGLRSLKVLMLNENFMLRSLATPSWSSVSSLSHLLLNNCNISSIKPLNEVVNSLEALWLFSNPVECDCEAVPVLRGVINHNVTVFYSISDQLLYYFLDHIGQLLPRVPRQALSLQ